MLASDGETLYAGSSEGVNAWRVTSGEWEALNGTLNGGRIRVLVAHGSSVIANVGQDRLWTSRDFGQTWSAGPVIAPDAEVLSVVFVDGTLYAGTDRFGIFESHDDGATFQAANDGLPTGIDPSLGLVFHPITSLAGTGDSVVAGTSYGALRRGLGDTQWAHRRTKGCR